jgi:HYR domain
VGTLSVPGLEFDVSPPVLKGIVSKTVRAPRGAKRMRVRYNVSARDEVDGAVRASCRPKSGSRFRIGRTVVNCSATDGSGNMATARFRITVKPRR